MYTACIVAVNLKIGIAGLGAIGGVVARALENGLAGFELEAVSTRDAERPPKILSELKRAVAVVDARELARRCDVIVECAPSAAFPDIVRPAAEAGRTIVTVSAAALIENMGLVDVA